MKKVLFLLLFFSIIFTESARGEYASSSNEAVIFNTIYEAMEKLNIPAKDIKGLDRISRNCRNIFHNVIVIKDGRAKIAHNIPEIVMELNMLEKNVNASSKEHIALNKALIILAKSLLNNDLSKNLNKLNLEAIKEREMYLLCRIVASLALFYEGVLSPEIQRVAAYATEDYSNNDSYIDKATKAIISLIEEGNEIAPQKLLKDRKDSAGNRLYGNFYGIYYGKNNTFVKKYYSLFVNNGEPTYNYYNFSYMNHAIETFYYNNNGDITHQTLFIKNVTISKGVFKLELCTDPLHKKMVESILKLRFLDKDRIEMVDSLQDGKSIYVKNINKYVDETGIKYKVGVSFAFDKVSSAIPAYFSSFDKRFVSKPYKKVKIGDTTYIIYISFIEAPSSIHKENVQINITLSLWKEDLANKRVLLSSVAALGSGGYLTDCEIKDNMILCRVFDKKNIADKNDDNNIVANYFQLQFKNDRLILTSYSSKAKLNGEKFQQVHFTGEMDASTVNEDILKELYKPYF